MLLEIGAAGIGQPVKILVFLSADFLVIIILFLLGTTAKAETENQKAQYIYRFHL
jgi:hypothetical protein